MSADTRETAGDRHGVVDSVLAPWPGLRTALDDLNERAWASTDQRLLELCRVRASMLLGFAEGVGSDVISLDEIEGLRAWTTSSHFSASEKAALAFAEQFVIDVATMDDETVETLRSALGDEGLMSFANAFLAVEQRIRMNLIFDRLFTEPGVLR